MLLLLQRCAGSGLVEKKRGARLSGSLLVVVCCPAVAADLEAQQRKGRGAPAWLCAEEMAALVAAVVARGQQPGEEAAWGYSAAAHGRPGEDGGSLVCWAARCATRSRRPRRGLPWLGDATGLLDAAMQRRRPGAVEREDWGD